MTAVMDSNAVPEDDHRIDELLTCPHVGNTGCSVDWLRPASMTYLG